LHPCVKPFYTLCNPLSIARFWFSGLSLAPWGDHENLSRKICFYFLLRLFQMILMFVEKIGFFSHGSNRRLTPIIKKHFAAGKLFPGRVLSDWCNHDWLLVHTSHLGCRILVRAWSCSPFKKCIWVHPVFVSLFLFFSAQLVTLLQSNNIPP
jgi:hypothetical protein